MENPFVKVLNTLMMIGLICQSSSHIFVNIDFFAKTRRTLQLYRLAQLVSVSFMDAEHLIHQLDLSPHPEGGWYRQTWVADGADRPPGTCIYFLLKHGEASHWHRVDAVEIWHFYAGTPLILSTSAKDAGPAVDQVLGPDFEAGQVPQIIVPKDHWQAASAPDGWALVGCTVSPGFQFDGFELAEPSFDIPRKSPG